MAAEVFALCAFLSITCAFLLFKGWVNNRIKLLFWSSLGFMGLALNNIFLFLNVVTGPLIDLSPVRTLPALIGMVILIYGLVTESV